MRTPLSHRAMFVISRLCHWGGHDYHVRGFVLFIAPASFSAFSQSFWPAHNPIPHNQARTVKMAFDWSTQLLPFSVIAIGIAPLYIIGLTGWFRPFLSASSHPLHFKTAPIYLCRCKKSDHFFVAPELGRGVGSPPCLLVWSFSGL